MIGNLPENELPPQSCRLQLQFPPTRLADGRIETRQASCSGTIIGKSQLLTAAHCFVGNQIQEAWVMCPGEPRKRISSWTTPVNYKKVDSIEEAGKIAPFDIAHVRIEGTFKATPAHLPKSVDEVLEILEKNKGKKSGCNLLGYGIDETGKVGKHAGRSVEFQKWKVGELIHSERNFFGVEKEVSREPIMEWFADNTLLLVKAQETLKEKGNVHAINHGDSGGGLLCPTDSDSPLMLGVIGGWTEKVEGNETVFVASVASLAHQMALVKNLLQTEEKTTTPSQPLVTPRPSLPRSAPPSPRTH